MVNINTTVQFVLDFKTLLSLVLQLSKEHRELLVSILQQQKQLESHSEEPLKIPQTNEKAKDMTDMLSDTELLQLIKQLG
ncbi:MAG: hypothetical protein MUE81_23255 [Thermoflexibacter sp.]|nr:hypothetical protein [Thermoflexibacter sp.]